MHEDRELISLGCFAGMDTPLEKEDEVDTLYTNRKEGITLLTNGGNTDHLLGKPRLEELLRVHSGVRGKWIYRIS